MTHFKDKTRIWFAYPKRTDGTEECIVRTGSPDAIGAARTFYELCNDEHFSPSKYDLTDGLTLRAHVHLHNSETIPIGETFKAFSQVLEEKRELYDGESVEYEVYSKAISEVARLEHAAKEAVTKWWSDYLTDKKSAVGCIVPTGDIATCKRVVDTDRLVVSHGEELIVKRKAE